MKKLMFILNSALLTANIALFIYFTVYTISGAYPLGDYINQSDIEFQLIVSIVFEFVFVFLSKLMSLIVKADLSFKGADVIKLIPKAILVTIIAIGACIILYSLIVKIHYEFLIMILVMTMFILIETGISILFKKHI